MGRADLSHTGTCGLMLRSTSHLSSLTAPELSSASLSAKVEAAADTLQHGLGDGNFLYRLAHVPLASRMIPTLLSIR